MFTHIVIHRPLPEHRAAVLESMHRVAKAAEGSPGLVVIDAAVIDEDRLLAVAIWRDRVSFQAAAPAIFQVVADDPFEEWEASDPEVLLAESS